YNPGSLNFVQGNKICSDASVTGTKPFSFVEKETLPDGVILDGETGRVCSDGSTGKITAGDYIIEVSNKAGKATSTLKLSGVVCQEGAIDVAYHVQSSDFGEIKYSVCRNGDWSDWIVRTVSFTSYESPSLLRESVTNNVSLKAYCSPNAFGLTISCVLAKEDNSGLKCKNKIQVFGNNTGSPSFSYTNDPATSSILELYNQTWNPNSIPRFEINPKGKEYLFIRFR
ncbi:MAG: hypothetical protein KDK36_08470, partial [Leptospiraceae bacterium]|nr:hypothetical protein [Leptospiraceae bacterium]